MEENKEIDFKNKLCKQVEEKINVILESGINENNLQALGMLVDIHKDLKNENYWEVKEEMYMYRESGYGRRYSEGGYGRRGVPGTGRGRYRGGRGSGRYRGEDEMEEMMDHYQNYNEAQGEFNEGNYGAEGEMVKSVDGIMKNVYAIIEELSEADSPEVMHIIKKYAKKINEMQ